jgi:hypothetical protein
MNRYVVERGIPGIGGSSYADLHGMAESKNRALAMLAPHVQWVQSFVAADRTFCVYLATGEAAIRRHAELSGVRADRIFEITSVLDPTTART